MNKKQQRTTIFRKICATICCLLLTICLYPFSAIANPNSTENNNSETQSQYDKDQLSKAKNAIEKMRDISTRLEMAYEDLNTATHKLEETTNKIEELNQHINETETKLERAKTNLNIWLKTTYKDGPVRYISVLLGAINFEDFVSRVVFLDYINANEKEILDEINSYKSELEKDQKELDKQYSWQKTYEERKSANASLIIDVLAEQVEYFNSLDEKARNAVLADDGIAGSGLLIFGVDGIKTTEGAHPEVAEYAFNFLGIPYVWGGETPSGGFDCSGLTMYCYEKAVGISLTHFARTQFFEGVTVAKSALMPGDLVFFGNSVETIHHVGIYIGADKFIHAPQTGDIVKISTLSARADYVGACRPQKR